MTTSTSLVTGVDFVSIPTTDLDAARAFYGDILGLECSAVWQGGETAAMGAEYETGTVTLALLACERFGIEFTPNVVPIALRVDDVAAAKQELEARGVEFSTDIIDSGVCHQAMFADPDGNALGLHHRYAPFNR